MPVWFEGSGFRPNPLEKVFFFLINLHKDSKSPFLLYIYIELYISIYYW